VIYNGHAYPLPCATNAEDPTFCPYESFVKYVGPMLPADYSVECDSKLVQEDLRTFDEKGDEDD
jgi:hypothetical protein